MFERSIRGTLFVPIILKVTDLNSENFVRDYRLKIAEIKALEKKEAIAKMS
jgi:hypothetical protein